MIAKLTGRFERAGIGRAVVDVKGVGYEVNVPDWLAKAYCGEHTFVHIHTIVKEDSITLYGFQATEDRSIFARLTSVSGVGPKTAMVIMEHLGAFEVSEAIRSGDPSIFYAVKGIGKKTAENILKLKGSI